MAEFTKQNGIQAVSQFRACVLRSPHLSSALRRRLSQCVGSFSCSRWRSPTKSWKWKLHLSRGNAIVCCAVSKLNQKSWLFFVCFYKHIISWKLLFWACFWGILVPAAPRTCNYLVTCTWLDSFCPQKQKKKKSQPWRRGLLKLTPNLKSANLSAKFRGIIAVFMNLDNLTKNVVVMFVESCIPLENN